MFKLCLFFMLATFGLHGAEVPFTIEVAENNQQRQWGLMGRSELPENQGMLFLDPRGAIWMFNVKIDLSVAFLDQSSKIISIEDLKAYPEMMDPERPILQISDMKKYPRDDKTFRFFMDHSVPIPKQTKYALEMNMGWFKKHQIQPGDKVVWTKGETKAFILKAN
jgi:uncharacterized protein